MTEDYRALYRLKEDKIEPNFVDEFGFIVKEKMAFQNNERVVKMEWYSIIDKFEKDRKRFKEAITKKRLLQRGVPLSMKCRIWKYLLIPRTGEIFKKTFLVDLTLYNPDKNTEVSPEYRQKYKSLTEEKSSYEYQIHVDIQRTFRHHFLFNSQFGRGQCELFNLLVAFSNSFKKIGYCQGLSDIGAIMLMYFPEDQAFLMLEHLVRKNKLEGLFDKNLTKLPEIMKMQRSNFYTVIPEIVYYLEKNCENYTIYFVGWYITLFSRFSIKLVLRVWDFMFYYGFNVLTYFAAGVLKSAETDILHSTGENLIKYLSTLERRDIDEMVVVDYVVKFLEDANYQNLDLKH